MVPNQYWVPGMLAPMPMMGKYFVYYGLDFLPPRELGKKCVERMVYELYNENSGVCRFHRKWAEVIVDEIISSHYHFPVDYKAHQFELAKQIYELDGGAVVPWESERTVDAVWKYLEDIGGDKPDAELAGWIERFRADKWAAARGTGTRSAGIAEAFAAGPMRSRINGTRACRGGGCDGEEVGWASQGVLISGASILSGAAHRFALRSRRMRPSELSVPFDYGLRPSAQGAPLLSRQTCG